MKGIESLAKDFFENKNVADQPKELQVGEEVYIIDQELIDTENDFYALIPAVVVGIDISTKIPGRKYYFFEARGSKVDELLNKYEERGFKFYKYLENTSPYIFVVKETIDLT